MTYRRWIWNMLIFLIVYVLEKTLTITSASYWRLIAAAVPISAFVMILYACALRIFEKDAFVWIASGISQRIRLSVRTKNP